MTFDTKEVEANSFSFDDALCIEDNSDLNNDQTANLPIDNLKWNTPQEQNIDQNLARANKWIAKAEKEAIKQATNPIVPDRLLRINIISMQPRKAQIISKISWDSNLANVKDLKSKKNIDLINKHFGLDKEPMARLAHLLKIIDKRKKEMPIYDKTGKLLPNEKKELKLNTYILWVLQMLAVLAGENVSIDFSRWSKSSTAFDKIQKLFDKEVTPYTHKIVTIGDDKIPEPSNYITKENKKFFWLTQRASAANNPRNPKITTI